MTLEQERDVLEAMLHRNLTESSTLDLTHPDHVDPGVAREFLEWAKIRLHDKQAPLDPEDLAQRRFDVTNFIALRGLLGQRTLKPIIKQINQLRDAEARLRSLSAAHITDAKVRSSRP